MLEAMRDSGVAGTGLVFHFLPQLFNRMWMGRPLAIIFFIGISFAAFTSYIALLSLLQSISNEMGINRIKFLVGLCVVLLIGSILPALDVSYLANQVDMPTSLSLMCMTHNHHFC